MSERGVFAIARGLFDHPAFAAEPFTEREAWVWMIENAAWRDTRTRVGRAPIELRRGQLAFATRFLATKWKWKSEARVRRFLNRLKSDAMVDVLATREATLITICNYDKWQFGRRTDEPQIDAQPDAPATHPRRKEEEVNNRINNNSSLRSELRSPAKRGSRLPEEWQPSGADLQAASQRLGRALPDELAKFRDYWKAQPGQRGVKLDWDATWRNWIRNSRAQPVARGSPHQQKPLSFTEIALQTDPHRHEPEPTYEPSFDLGGGPVIDG